MGSCDELCASHGGYNAATLNYAGSNGTLANCLAVAAAINPSSGETYYSDPEEACDNASGCEMIFDSYHPYYARGDVHRCTSPATTSSATANYGTGSGAMAFYGRVCACNN